MRNRVSIALAALAVVLAIILFAPTFVASQSTDATKFDKVPTTPKGWTMPRTPDGVPDLHGYWTNVTFAPMERPAKYGNREFLTEKEALEVYNAGIQHTFDGAGGSGDAENDPTSADYDFKTYGLSPWQEGVRPNLRTSLVVDPPDGRIPALTPAGKARRAGARPEPLFEQETAKGELWNGKVHADVPTDLGVGVTCRAFGGRAPIQAGAGYNNGLFIVQSKDYVVIEKEYGTEDRVIPLTGAPHLSSTMHQWLGDSRGHWEGDTLVVETTNFRPENTYMGANPATLKITEYFTRVGPEQIEYKYKVDDPQTWSRPWTVIEPWNSIKGPLWEYACSESNMDAVQILQGARNAEKAAAAKAKAGVPISQK